MLHFTYSGCPRIIEKALLAAALLRFACSGCSCIIEKAPLAAALWCSHARQRLCAGAACASLCGDVLMAAAMLRFAVCRYPRVASRAAAMRARGAIKLQANERACPGAFCSPERPPARPHPSVFESALPHDRRGPRPCQDLRRACSIACAAAGLQPSQRRSPSLRRNVSDTRPQNCEPCAALLAKPPFEGGLGGRTLNPKSGAVWAAGVGHAAA